MPPWQRLEGFPQGLRHSDYNGDTSLVPGLFKVVVVYLRPCGAVDVNSRCSDMKHQFVILVPRMSVRKARKRRSKGWRTIAEATRVHRRAP